MKNIKKLNNNMKFGKLFQIYQKKKQIKKYNFKKLNNWLKINIKKYQTKERKLQYFINLLFLIKMKKYFKQKMKWKFGIHKNIKIFNNKVNNI